MKADDSIACWGDNREGQAPATLAGSYRSVSAGVDHTCAVKADDSVACWGNNDFGQVSAVPAGSYTSVSARGSYACAVRVDDTTHPSRRLAGIS